MWTDLLVEKLLQTLPPLLNERVIKYAIVSSERKLPEKGFSRERWYDHLKKTKQSELKQLHKPASIFKCFKLMNPKQSDLIQ